MEVLYQLSYPGGSVDLKGQGLIEQAEGPAGADARRRYYRLTDLGLEIAQAEAARLSRLVRHARAADLLPGRR